MRHCSTQFGCFHINEYLCVFRIQPSNLHELLHWVICSCTCGITLVRLYVLHFLSYSYDAYRVYGISALCEYDKKWNTSKSTIRIHICENRSLNVVICGYQWLKPEFYDTGRLPKRNRSGWVCDQKRMDTAMSHVPRIWNMGGGEIPTILSVYQRSVCSGVMLRRGRLLSFIVKYHQIVWERLVPDIIFWIPF